MSLPVQTSYLDSFRIRYRGAHVRITAITAITMSAPGSGGGQAGASHFDGTLPMSTATNVGKSNPRRTRNVMVGPDLVTNLARIQKLINMTKSYKIRVCPLEAGLRSAAPIPASPIKCR